MTRLRLAFVLPGLWLPIAVWGADPAPQFTPEGIVRGDGRVRTLVPGAVMSIYGAHLGSVTSGCAATPGGAFANIPCDTQVFVGERLAELLFVSENQINFKIPLDAPASIGEPLRVVYKGQSSAPFVMPVGPEKTTVSVEQPAYSGLPVWLKVDLPFENGTIRYPYVLGLAGFGCNEVEVRKNGKPLPQVPRSKGGQYAAAFVGNICGYYAIASPLAVKGRLPLHLVYDFQTPGTYEVRFTLRNVPFGALSEAAFQAQSEWTSFEILPSETGQRANWLNSMRASPQVDAAEALTDTLPGLLGVPDDLSLEILSGYLYHPDSQVRQYAMRGLSYWPDKLVAQKLLSLLETRGPSDVIEEFFVRHSGAKAVPGKRFEEPERK